MDKRRIGIIEDDKVVSDVLRESLQLEGYETAIAATCTEAEAMLEEGKFDCFLLDLTLPDGDGLELCKKLSRGRAAANAGIIIMSGKNSERDVILGLEFGADDYITKPFSQAVLLSRLKAVLRRLESVHSTPPGKIITIGEVEINTEKFTVRSNGDEVRLSRSEFLILQKLAENPGRVYTRGQLIDAVSGPERAVTDRAIDTQILNIRKKLGDAGGIIETVRGVGYCLAPHGPREGQ